MWTGVVWGASPQEMAVKGTVRDLTRKVDKSNTQLFLINDAGVCPGVDEGDQGMGTLWKEESGVKQGSFPGRRDSLGRGSNYLLLTSLVTGEPWLLTDSQ